MLYSVKSLEEIAAFFDAQADSATRQARAKRTAVREGLILLHEAAIWREAASVVRQTEFRPETETKNEAWENPEARRQRRISEIEASLARPDETGADWDARRKALQRELDSLRKT